MTAELPASSRGARALRAGALLVALAGCSPALGPPSTSSGAAGAGPQTPAPAGRLPPSVEPVSYALELAIDPSQPSFSGIARIDVELAEPRSSITLHGAGLHIERASVQRPEDTAPAPARVSSQGALIELALAQPIGPGRVVLAFEYTGAFDDHLLGLYRVESAGRAYAFTQFEAIHARQAFPCFDEPRFKTPFDVKLRVPRGAAAISNTRATETRELSDTTTEVSFARTEKLPTYLVAFAVGPLDVVAVEDVAASAVRPTPLPLRGVAAQGRGAELATALADTPRLLDSLERYTGVPYPYDKLDLIAVPDFSAGAMENAGAITFRDTLLLMGAASPEWQRRASISVNAHELAHQWFGNLVTMPWWDDIWLNEAFATWLAGRVLEEVHPEFRPELARVAAVDRAMDVDSRASARQIRQPIESDHDIKNAFDSITYVKGAAVLGMFEKYLGEDAFQRGLRSYLERHRFGTATSEDLLSALEQASGRTIAASFGTFLEQAGVPSVNAELVCAPGAPPKVLLRQSRYVPLGSSAARTGLWQVPVCIVHGRAASSASSEGSAGSRAQGATEQCTLLATLDAEIALGSSECPSWILPNAGASGYYRWALASKDFDALLERGFPALGAAEKLSLLSNAEAAARAGSQRLDQLLALTERVGRERPRELVQASLSVLVRLRDALFGEEELPAYRRLVRSLVGPRVRELGLIPPDGTSKQQTGDDKLTRPLVVGALALEAKDDVVRRELERLGRARLGLAEDARLSRLPSELVEVALSVAVQNGGAAIVDRLEAELARSTDGLERMRMLAALGNNEDPTLTPRILGLTLGKSLRNNELAGLTLSQVRQHATREAAYAWISEHFAALVERFGKQHSAPLLSSASSFCEAAGLARARELFTPRAADLPGGPRTLKLALESAEACVAFAALHRPSAKAALAKLEEAR